MRLLTLALILLIRTLPYAQNGFIQTYDYDGGGMAFYNMLLKEDTLIVYGVAKDFEGSQWGLYFAKMDTLGNILMEKLHYDEDGRSYAFEQGYTLLPTSDGGYAITGVVFQEQIPALFKLDATGEVQFIREYPDTTTLSKRHWNIVETPNGFISTGIKQRPEDGLFDAFIMRTNREGIKLWEFNYGELGVWDNLEGISRINNNEYLFTGYSGISTLQVDNYADIWSLPKAIKMDTLGNVTWQWTGEIAYTGGPLSSFTRLYPTPDNNWVTRGSVSTLLAIDDMHYQSQIVKRDTNFDVIWDVTFGEPTSNRNNFVNFARAPDDGWVAVGQYVVPEASHPGGSYRASMIAKVSAEGDSLWSRTDTLYNPHETASQPYLSGVVVLPSGSIIACGQVDKTWPAPAFSKGWLIKIDDRGCLEPGCNPLVDGVNLVPPADLNVFPNPAGDFVNVSTGEPFAWELYDAHGRRLSAEHSSGTQTRVDLRAQPAGVYYLRVRQGRVWSVRRLVKQ